jgi:hypothetical protein
MDSTLTVNYGQAISEKQIELFLGMYVNTCGLFAVQNSDGTYAYVRRPLEPKHVRMHLEGKLTLGLLVGEDGTTKFGVVDIDSTCADAVMETWTRCDEMGLPFITVFSGCKGYHVQTFFDKPTDIRKAREVMKLISGEHEVWPRQSSIAPGEIGNCIKAPFGIHRKTGRWCIAVNRDFETVEDHWAVLRNVEHANADRVLAEAYLRAQGLKERSSTDAVRAPEEMKPCLINHFRLGTDQGLRNRMGFALACEMRRVGTTEQQASSMLTEWNRKNRPPLPVHEVEVLVRSAYRRDKPYEYGCNPNGALREMVACSGRTNCPYYRQLVRRNLIAVSADSGSTT